MLTLCRVSRLTLASGVLTLVLPAAAAARDQPPREPTETQLMQRYGKPSQRDRVWNAAPSQRDYDRDGLHNADDWDDDNDGLLDDDEDDE